ncbi:MAG: hypothetical protein FD172_3744, partial [Methylocystaceae bacterium]
LARDELCCTDLTKAWSPTGGQVCQNWLQVCHAPMLVLSRVVSGIVYVIRHGLQWKDAPKGYGPHKTLYNRFIRWSRLGVFDRIFASLAAEGPKPERI